MVANRDSIIKVGRDLAELVIEHGGTTPTAIDLARRMLDIIRLSGTYTRRYDDPEERVLNRHLNLYINKRDKAKTDIERTKWQGKIAEQQAKIRAYKGGDRYLLAADLDLDGL